VINPAARQKTCGKLVRSRVLANAEHLRGVNRRFALVRARLLTALWRRGTVVAQDRSWRMSACVRRTVLALAVMAITAWAAPASAANWLEMNFGLSGPRYDSALPQCEAALGTIASGFAAKESRFWNTNLHIVDFTQVRETALRPWAEQSIPRRFCSAEAQVSDGLWRKVHYSIAEDTGLIGASWGVQWCVVELDRNWAHNPGCRMARP
jgi:hypothetical protein